MKRVKVVDVMLDVGDDEVGVARGEHLGDPRRRERAGPDADRGLPRRQQRHDAILGLIASGGGQRRMVHRPDDAGEGGRDHERARWHGFSISHLNLAGRYGASGSASIRSRISNAARCATRGDSVTPLCMTAM